MPDQFVEYVMELFGPFGTVTARRMFGGHGIYLDGLMFVIVSGEALYLKADEMSRSEFERARCEPFRYTRSGKPASLNFFRAPDESMDSPELMLPWARSAYAAALRASAKAQAAAQARAARKTAAARQSTGSTKKRAAQKAARPARGKTAREKRASRRAARK